MVFRVFRGMISRVVIFLRGILRVNPGKDPEKSRKNRKKLEKSRKIQKNPEKTEKKPEKTEKKRKKRKTGCQVFMCTVHRVA